MTTPQRDYISARLDLSNECITVSIDRIRNRDSMGPAPSVIIELDWDEACTLRDAIDDAIKTPPRKTTTGDKQ